MLGKTYVLSNNSESTFWLSAFEAGLIGESTEVTVTKVAFEYGLHGATELKVGKNTYGIDSENFWCFFTENMVEDSRYAISEKVEDDKEKRVQGAVNRLQKKFGEVVTKPLEDRYNEWILENIHVYELFCKFTLQAIESGKKKISHWLIVNRLRWEVEIETKGLCEEDKEYKISNDYIAFLARDFIKDYPEHESIFNLKQMKRV